MLARVKGNLVLVSSDSPTSGGRGQSDSDRRPRPARRGASAGERTPQEILDEMRPARWHAGDEDSRVWGYL